VEKDIGMYYRTSPLSSSLMIKLWDEVRTNDGEMRNPVPLASDENSLMQECFYLDFIQPMVLKGKFRICLSLTLVLRSFPRTTSSRGKGSFRFFFPPKKCFINELNVEKNLKH